jgi:hypothetical protein
MTFRGGLNAAGPITVTGTVVGDGTNNYDDILVGNTWIFTSAATVTALGGSFVVESGDQLIFRGPIAGATATNGELTNNSSWTVVQNNIGAASETTAGYVELATDAETQTGTDTSRAITPANLSSRTATETRR